MKRPLIVATLIIIAVVVLVAALLYQWLRPHEMTYQGRPLGVWLAELEDDSTEVRARAEAALHQLGTNAFPALLAGLRAHDSRFDETVKPLAARLPLLHLPYEPAATRRERAALAFRILGPEAAPATLQLIQILLGERTSVYAAYALAGIGPESAIPLTAAMTNHSSRVRSSAAFALGTLRTNAVPVVPALIDALSDGDVKVRLMAATSLGELAEEPSLVVPALVERLDDKKAKVRIAAARALAKFGRNAQAAIPALSRATADDDSAFAAIATEALKTIQNDSATGARQ